MQRTNKTIPLKTQFSTAVVAIVRIETPTEVPAAKQTKNNKNEVLQNEIEILKTEIESMRKDHSVVSQIPTRQQLLPYPPSKLSPQTTAVESTQKE